jgi:hypothetical protein
MIKISLQAKKIKTNLKGFFLSFCNGFFFLLLLVHLMNNLVIDQK